MHNSATEFSIQRVQMHCCACGILHLEATKAQFRYGILHSEGTNALLRMRNSPFRGYKFTFPHTEFLIWRVQMHRCAHGILHHKTLEYIF